MMFVRQQGLERGRQLATTGGGSDGVGRNEDLPSPESRLNEDQEIRMVFCAGATVIICPA